MIPIFNPAPQYALLKDTINEALAQVAASGQYILGPQVSEFETQFAESTGSAFSVGVNSGTDALLLALRALDIGPGDEVITTPFSYVATSEAIVRTGARPVFVDVEASTFNLDLNAVRAAITERTRAIIPVHLFGLAVDMTELMTIARENNLYVVEDCAQATGATWHGQQVGTFGAMGCFSFFPTKNLGAMGDAGAITTQDEALANRLKSLRVHGATPQNRYDHQESGINSRLDTMQAVVLLAKLPHLEEWNTQRRQIANFYTQAILNGPLKDKITPPAVPHMASTHVFHQYTVKLNTPNGDLRNQVVEALKAHDVMAMIYYPIPLHLQQTHANLGYKPGDLPVAEQLAQQVFSLPMFPGMTQDQQAQVIRGLEAVFASVPCSV